MYPNYGKIIERSLRWMPSAIGNPVIRSINPIRVRRAKALKAPRWITLFITNYCNARCEHCFYWSELNNKSAELSIAELKTLLNSFRHSVNTIRLSGGEPFLRKDIEEFVLAADATELIRKVSIPTDGQIIKSGLLYDRREKFFPTVMGFA